MKKIFILLMALLLMGSSYVFGQENDITLDDYILSRTYDSNGNEIVEIIVPGKPPDNHREPVADPSRSAVTLGNVPAFNWSFGCSATTAAMAAGYYDNNGYTEMYTGPTNGGVMPLDNSVWAPVVINGEMRDQCPLSATRNTIDGRTIRGHVDDYWVQYGSTAIDPYITNGWTQHTYGDCTGDFMGTNQSALANVDGGTTFYMNTNGSPLYNYTGSEPAKIDGCHGFRDFYESRGYEVIQNYSQYIFGYNSNTIGFTFDQYKQEIDAGRPVIIQVLGHSMLGYGYDDTGTLVYLHDTWDYSSHSMTWGGSYYGMAHFGVTVVWLGSNIPPPTPGLWTGATSSNWGTTSNWDDGVVPSSTTNVSISPNAVNWPSYSGNFIVGSQCYNMTIPPGSEITVTGNFTINPGCSLAFSGDGELSVSGDWTNNGTFSPGSGTINFFGATPSTVNPPIAAVANYALSTFTKGMTALTDATIGSTGNDKSSVIPIGFTFNYAGTNYLNARFCTNGWISLDQTGNTSKVNEDLFTVNAPNTALTPWWDDLEDDATSSLSYKTEGSAPNRVFTAEWNRVKAFSSVATTRISFQVKLYESTNIIEFHYGTLEAGTPSGSEGASIGIEDATGGSGHFIEATTASTTAGKTDLVSTNNWPAVNYRFTPPVASQTFHNITISKSSANLDFNVNTVVEGLFNLAPGAFFKVLNGKTITVGD